MTEVLTAEQVQLRAVVRALLEKESAEHPVQGTMETARGYEPVLWKTMAGLGWHGLAIPEDCGGTGAGWIEQGLVFEELGRALVCAPYLSTVGLAAPALLASNDAQAKARWLPGIAQGELIATVAGTERSGRWRADDMHATATRDGDCWRISGSKPHVLDGAVAGLLLVLARGAGGVSLFAVEPAVPGLRVTAPVTSDRTRRIARLDFEEVPAVLVGAEGGAWVIAEAMLRQAHVALACEQAGGAVAALEMAVRYAKTRVQFGRPIGSFQAIKHKCADMLVAVETARTAAWAAVRAIDENNPDLPLIAAIAGAVCSEAYMFCASECVQIHGGVGYTWEHPAQLHVKRSRGSAVLLGTPAEHRARVAELARLFGHQPQEGTPL